MQFDVSRVEVVVAPPSMYIPAAKNLLDPKIQVCAQNISATNSGSFTGEMSAEQLKDFGVNWTLLGHPERRVLYGETNE